MVNATGCRICILLGIVLGLAGCVTKQDLKGMDARLLALEEGMAGQATVQKEISGRLSTLDAGVVSQEQDLRSSYARIRSEIDTLRLSIQKMQGGMEESAFRSRDIVGKDSALSDEIVFLKEEFMKLSGRLQHLSDYVGLETAKATPGAGKVSGQKNVKKEKKEALPAPPRDLDTLYAEGKQAFDKGGLEKARDTFREILKRFPNSSRADNAQFWVGEIYYRENAYEEAILEYQKVIDVYPKGNKVASALLKQGLAFEKLGQKADARLIIEELVRKYPGSSESLIGQRKLRKL